MPAQDQARGTASIRTARVGGIAVRIAGDGVPVLLLHGIGGASTSFSDQQAGLPGYATIAWDAPGYGDSDDPAPGPSPDAPADLYADAALAVLRGLGRARAHVVGVSWGGVIATRIALRHPEALLSLTLADSSRGSGRTAQGRAGMQRRVKDLAELGPGAMARLRGPNLLAPGASDEVAGRVIATMARVRAVGYQAAAEMMASTDHSADLPLIALPTLILVGEHDQVTGVPESRAIASAIPGAQFEVLPGGGHAVHQENPAAFNARLLRFLTEVDRGSARD